MCSTKLLPKAVKESYDESGSEERREEAKETEGNGEM